MNPEHKELAEKVIDFFKKSDKSKLIPARDLLHLLPDNNIAEKVIIPLEKDFGLIERLGEESFRLTKNGWDFSSFSNLKQEKKSEFINNDFRDSTIGQVNQSSNFSNNPQTIKITAKSNKEQKKGFIIRFWKLISENKLISGILLIVIVYLIKVIFGIDLKN